MTAHLFSVGAAASSSANTTAWVPRHSAMTANSRFGLLADRRKLAHIRGSSPRGSSHPIRPAGDERNLRAKKNPPHVSVGWVHKVADPPTFPAMPVHRRRRLNGRVGFSVSRHAPVVCP